MKKHTQKILAESLGVSDRTLRNWKAQGCPVDRGFDAVSRWRQANAPERRSAAPDDSEMQGLKRRLVKAQAEHYETKTKLAEIEHRVKTGQLVSLEQVEAYLREWYGPVSEYLKNQPDRLAHRVNPADPEHAWEVLDEERTQIFRIARDAISKDLEGGAE